MKAWAQRSRIPDIRYKHPYFEARIHLESLLGNEYVLLSYGASHSCKFSQRETAPLNMYRSSVSANSLICQLDNPLPSKLVAFRNMKSLVNIEEGSQFSTELKSSGVIEHATKVHN